MWLLESLGFLRLFSSPCPNSTLRKHGFQSVGPQIKKKKKRLKELIATKLVLQEMLKGLLEEAVAAKI